MLVSAMVLPPPGCLAGRCCPSPWNRGTVDRLACYEVPWGKLRSQGSRPWVKVAERCSARASGLVGESRLAAGRRACHLPSGQIPPPWAQHEVEARAARAARTSSQAARPLRLPGGEEEVAVEAVEVAAFPSELAEVGLP